MLGRRRPGWDSGGCVGYDFGLRAHGRFRCPVGCRKLVTGPISPQMQRLDEALGRSRRGGRTHEAVPARGAAFGVVCRSGSVSGDVDDDSTDLGRHSKPSGRLQHGVKNSKECQRLRVCKHRKAELLSRELLRCGDDGYLNLAVPTTATSGSPPSSVAQRRRGAYPGDTLYSVICDF